MPNERSPHETGIPKPGDQRVEDIEQAWVGAHAEKAVRDLAREEGVSEEEKAILDRLAERRGEKAMQEYAAEKEKNPIEILLSRVDRIASEMRKEGLEQDAEIVEKIRNRFNEYVRSLSKSEEALEKKLNRKVSLSELQEVRLSDFEVGIGIPVMNRIGESGGRLYQKNGKALTGFGDVSGLQAYTERVKASGKPAILEGINFTLSKQGETEFYRALGVLGEGEEVIDIPTIYQKAEKEENVRRGKDVDTTVDTTNYRVTFPTNIEGVRLDIMKRQMGTEGREERTGLEFDEKFIETILAKE